MQYLSHKYGMLEREFDYTDSSSLITKFKGGGAGEHPRRCTGRSTQTGKQCQRFGLIGTNPPRCKYHGATVQLRRTGGIVARTRGRVRGMPNIYRRFLRPAMSAFVSEALNISPDEQLNLLEELAIMRHAAGTTVEKYGMACEAVDDIKQKLVEAPETERTRIQNVVDKLEQVKQLHQAEMTGMLIKVGELAEKAAKVAERSKGNYTIAHLQFAVDQMLLIHREVCGDNLDLADRFAQAIKDSLLLPTKDNEATKLHPDETARLFDESVPYVPEDDEDEE